MVKIKKVKSYKVILFDLDGTLTDPKVGITKSVQYALKHFRIQEASLDNLVHFIGPPLKESFINNYGFDANKADAALQKYREYFAETGIYENKIFPGIPELLEKLVAQGKTLAVATAKPTVFAEKILKHFGIYNFFSVISGVSLENSMIPKETIIRTALTRLGIDGNKITSSEVIMIGDRKHDVVGANKAGIDSIAVLYGYGSLGELKKENPTYVVESVSRLEKLLLDKSIV